jgi:CheY-like chemotaxis protein
MNTTNSNSSVSEGYSALAGAATMRKTVLVVTNDHRSKELAPVWLGKAGFDVTLAETAQDALRIVAACPISVTLADAAMTVDEDRTLIRELESLCGSRAPVMGLCADKAEVELAHISRAADAFEGPHDWQAISRCCVKILGEQEILEQLEAAYLRLTTRETNSPA